MDIQEVSAFAGVVTVVVGGFNWLTSQRINTFKSDVGKWRADDKQEIKDWINGSFMRAKEVHARMDASDHRIDRIEERVDGL